MRLKVWICAFIPRDVPGYTKAIKKGRHSGKTAVPLPAIARTNPLNTFKNLDAGYLTDQRSFSPSVTASHRMQSRVDFDLSRTPKIVYHGHTSSGTTEVDMETGAQLDFDTAKMNRCSFSPLHKHTPPAGVARGSTQYRVPLGGNFTVNHPTTVSAPHPVYRTRLKAAAGDPLVSAAADIDYMGVFELSLDPARPKKCMITFEGKIDAFPAFECYAELSGVVKEIFRSSPPAGNTVTDLLGGPNRAVHGVAAF